MILHVHCPLYRVVWTSSKLIFDTRKPPFWWFLTISGGMVKDGSPTFSQMICFALWAEHLVLLCAIRVVMFSGSRKTRSFSCGMMFRCAFSWFPFISISSSCPILHSYAPSSAFVILLISSCQYVPDFRPWSQLTNEIKTKIFQNLIFSKFEFFYICFFQNRNFSKYWFLKIWIFLNLNFSKSENWIFEKTQFS